MHDSSDLSSRYADVILIPVHNRRETTLSCLGNLRTDGVMDWATVLVIDDCSTDGTAAAITNAFPEVRLLRGETGDWWWGGAMRRGMQWALACNARRIYWLNDDCRPPPGALPRMREMMDAHDDVVFLPALTPSGWRYGGYRRGAWSMRRCTDDECAAGMSETVSGNCVGLPLRWVDATGLPDSSYFPHHWADFDYGLRLHRQGACFRRVPNLVADNDDPTAELVESWRRSRRSSRELLAVVLSRRSVYWPPAWWRFALRHWPWWQGWMVFALPYFRLALILAVKLPTPVNRRPVDV